MTTEETLKAVHPNGHALALQQEPILPGETAQLFCKLQYPVLVKGIALDEGGEVVFVIAGAGRKYEPPAEGKTWADVFAGAQLSPQSYVIVVVKNTTAETRAFGGVLWVEGDAPKQNLTQAQAAQKVSQQGGGHHYHAPRPSNKPTQSATVTPGMNEVAILLKRGEAMRLLQSLKGGMPIIPSEAPAYIRCIENALERQ